MDDDLFISRRALADRLGRPDAPFILDVRHPSRFAASEHRVAAALRRLPPDAGEREVVVYCLHGHALSQQAALERLATIVRGADTDRLGLDPACAGLLGVSLGLARLHAADDHALLVAGLPVYDALYAWCVAEVSRSNETHTWRPL